VSTVQKKKKNLIPSLAGKETQPVLFLFYVLQTCSLRSKRFRRAYRKFPRPFAFRRRENWGERNTDGSSGEGEECFKPEESPAETLATKASTLGIFAS